MANVFHKFQDVFYRIMDAPDDESRKAIIMHEQMMTADFVGTLRNIRDAEDRDEASKIIEDARTGTHRRFADELAEFDAAENRAIGNRAIDSLVVLMNEYASIMVLIKNGTREAGDAIIEKCLE